MKRMVAEMEDVAVSMRQGALLIDNDSETARWESLGRVRWYSNSGVVSELREAVEVGWAARYRLVQVTFIPLLSTTYLHLFFAFSPPLPHFKIRYRRDGRAC